MVAELRTKCGCTQRIEVPDPPSYMREIQWPLHGHPYDGDGNFDLDSEVTMKVRRFFYQGTYYSRLYSIAHYLEEE